MKYVLLHSESFRLEGIQDALASEGIERRIVQAAGGLTITGDPTVLVLDPDMRSRIAADDLSRFVHEGGSIVALGREDESDVPPALRAELLGAFLPHPVGVRQLLVALRSAYRESAGRIDVQRARAEAASRTREIGELTRIGMALVTERDYNTLLNLILAQARRLTASDAGSLYLVETLEDESRQLRFTLTQNDSRPDIPFVEFTIPIDTASIAGYVATTNAPVVLDDAYVLPSNAEYSINRSFDQKYGYRTKSMLTLPMTDHHGEVIGVLQLINRKRAFELKLESPDDFESQVIAYSKRLVELVSALAGQAAVSIENSRLYEDIERLFEGFVRASVTAIEQRDPTTFGHSGRVADMTVDLAQAVDRVGSGPYRDVRFSKEEVREIRYAGLLHDFGKVGVREQVLVKAKKLYPPDLALVRQRYAFIRRTAEQQHYKRRLEYLEGGQPGYEEFARALKEEFDTQISELDRFLELVLQSNEPTVLPEGNFEELLRYANEYFEDLDGQKHPFLQDDEVRFLSIRKGSLDDTERAEIESHVTHTYRFLKQIPWTKELQSIPLIAYGHHEKLDGSGYPRRVAAQDIPIQTRMMTISDIFDALTASDRPYKRAVPSERALDIMKYEVADGMLDQELFETFIQTRVFDATGKF